MKDSKSSLIFRRSMAKSLRLSAIQKEAVMTFIINFFSRKDPGSKNDLRGGRVAQMLFYLNDVEEGGELQFSNLGVRVLPKRGRALLWYGARGMSLPKKKGSPLVIPKILRSNPCAMHRAMPVEKVKSGSQPSFYTTYRILTNGSSLLFQIAVKPPDRAIHQIAAVIGIHEPVPFAGVDHELSRHAKSVKGVPVLA